MFPSNNEEVQKSFPSIWVNLDKDDAKSVKDTSYYDGKRMLKVILSS